MELLEQQQGWLVRGFYELCSQCSKKTESCGMRFSLNDILDQLGIPNHEQNSPSTASTEIMQTCHDFPLSDRGRNRGTTPPWDSEQAQTTGQLSLCQEKAASLDSFDQLGSPLTVDSPSTRSEDCFPAELPPTARFLDTCAGFTLQFGSDYRDEPSPMPIRWPSVCEGSILSPWAMFCLSTNVPDPTLLDWKDKTSMGETFSEPEA